MSKFKRSPSFPWPKGWFAKPLAYSKKEYEIRYNGKYLMSVREELRADTLAWLIMTYPVGINLQKEGPTEPEWE